MALRWLLLHGLPCVKHKMINCHGLSGHHVFVTFGFSFREVNRFCSYLLGFLNKSFGFNRGLGLGEGFLNRSLGFNKHVS